MMNTKTTRKEVSPIEGAYEPSCSISRVDQVSLRETLRPLRNLTYYCGLLTDWEQQEELCTGLKIYKWISYLAIGLNFSLLLCVTAFELAQLIIEVVINLASIRQMVMNFVWFATFPTIMFTQYCYLRRRKEVAAFLNDWTKLEEELSCLCLAKKFHRALYATYFLMGLASTISLGVQVYKNPQASFLISHYPAILGALTLPVTGAFHVITIALGWILITLNDVLPTYLYSHLGCAIYSLSQDLSQCFEDLDKKSSKFSISIRSTWFRFERMCDFLARTDQLFGSMIVFAHGYCVFMMSTLLYLILNDLGVTSERQDMLAFTTNVICTSIRLVACTILAAKVDKYASHLRATLTSLLSQKWDVISTEDREITAVFLNRLQCDKVAGCPMGLYYLTLSFLLNVIGLIISYVIILLQSK